MVSYRWDSTPPDQPSEGTVDFTDGQPVEQLKAAGELPDGWKQGELKGLVADVMCSHDLKWHRVLDNRHAIGVRLNLAQGKYEPLRCIKAASQEQLMGGRFTSRMKWVAFPNFPMFDDPVTAMVWLEIKLGDAP